MAKPKAIDLFCGCGGLTLGLKYAGFDVIAGIEMDALAAESYRGNHKSVKLFEQDINSMSASQLLRILQLKKGDLDLLAGCPPCQGFSTMTTLNGKYATNDKRNDLVFQFLRFVRVLRPKTVMMENVPRLHQDPRKSVLTKALKSMGYKIAEGILDASDYGVPQRRKRFIMLAARGQAVEFLPTFKKRVTVREAFSKLWSIKKDDPLHNTEHRRIPRIQQLISLIPKDGGSRKDLPTKFQLKCHQNFNGFSDVYGRMKWDTVAPTITGGCINPSKGRFIHPNEDRAITLREAAVLQGFPKNYNFSLKNGKYAVAMLIGNAVPPKFSQMQAAVLKSTISQIKPYSRAKP